MSATLFSTSRVLLQAAKRRTDGDGSAGMVLCGRARFIALSNGTWNSTFKTREVTH